MEIYEKIIADITENQLENFELESQSRKYIGYTLFQRHYYYLLVNLNHQMIYQIIFLNWT